MSTDACHKSDHLFKNVHIYFQWQFLARDEGEDSPQDDPTWQEEEGKKSSNLSNHTQCES